MLAQQKYDERHDAYLNGTLKKKPEEPTADYSKALKEYKNLLKEYPNYRRIDEVLFSLGPRLDSSELEEAGRAEDEANYDGISEKPLRYTGLSCCCREFLL